MASPRKSAGIVLTRRVGVEAEVYLVRRADALRFFGGFFAFPGGVLDAAEASSDADADTAYQRCAARELFEETGVLLMGHARARGATDRSALRRALIAGDLQPWLTLLDAEPRDATQTFQRVLEITTPAFSPVRYETIFYHAELPAGEAPEIWPGELVAGQFIAPALALAEWRAGNMLIAPPVLLVLEMLAAHGVDAFARHARAEGAELAAGKLHPVRYCPGIFTAPLTTRTRPPATTTNCFLVGAERIYIVDPGSDDPAEHERLDQRLAEYLRRGASLAGVLLTHHHPDHVAGVVRVCERYGLAVHAHSETLLRLPHVAVKRHEVADGAEFELGAAPDGSPNWRLRALHTPGHARGHLAFVETRYQNAIVGDLLSTVSSILIDPPEGHLRTYLHSLERLRALDLRMLHPSHGPAVRDGRALIDSFLAHRRAREDAIVAALRAGPRSNAELLAEAYADTPPQLMKLAERALAAGLEKLVEDGLVTEVRDRWRLLEKRDAPV
ncbi:MAG: MBL fold metallo-hydrolase [Planctomycetota bacterium]